MKTDICIISKDLTTFDSIFKEVEKTAQYNELSKKQALQLRLLAEELVGMLPELLEIGSGEFWIENEGKDFELHAAITAERISAYDKENVLSVSKSGKNAAAVGIVNKIKLIAEGMLEDYLEMSSVNGAFSGYYDIYTMGANVNNAYYEWTNGWSLNSYRESVGSDKDTDEWDELEKSIIANLADDVVVGVIGKKVDIIIKKKFV